MFQSAVLRPSNLSAILRQRQTFSPTIPCSCKAAQWREFLWLVGQTKKKKKEEKKNGCASSLELSRRFGPGRIDWWAGNSIVASRGPLCGPPCGPKRVDSGFNSSLLCFFPMEPSPLLGNEKPSQLYFTLPLHRWLVDGSSIFVFFVPERPLYFPRSSRKCSRLFSFLLSFSFFFPLAFYVLDQFYFLASLGTDHGHRLLYSLDTT